MSNGRLVQVLKEKHGMPYVAFELHKYFGQELTKLVGQAITVRKCTTGDGLTAVSPDGATKFNLYAQHSPTS